MTPLTADQAARALEHQRLVSYAVRTIGVPAPHRDDAWQDGFIGLCRAIQLDDGSPESFGGYAFAWIRQAIQQGRATREGSNFRKAQTSRTLYVAPLSIDEKIAELLLDQVDVEDEVIASMAAADLQARLFASCDTVMDVDIVCGLLMDLERRIGQDEAIAKAHGVSPSLVLNRRRTLRRRMAEEVAA